MKDIFDNRLRIIGITGTNGKTTTGHMIEAIFKEANREIEIMGEHANVLSIGESEGIFRFLYKTMERGKDWAIVEIPFQGLEEKFFEEIILDTAIITNISIGSSEHYKDGETSLNNKKILFQGLRNNSKAIINGDDSWALKMVEGKNNIYLITYGLRTKSTATASSIDISQGIEFNYCLQRSLDSYRQKRIYMQEFPIEINLLGYQNIYNSLAAITTALIYEIPVDIIQRALKKFKPITRRLEYYALSTYQVLDNYAQNPSSFDAGFQTLQTIDYGKAFILVAIKGNTGININKEIAEIISHWCSLLEIENLYITQYNEKSNKKIQVSQEERKVFLKTLEKKEIPYTFIPNLEESIERIMTKAKSKDIIAFFGDEGIDGAKETMKKIINKNQTKIFQ